jgi:N-acyl-L-homoserine lactone synthetase
MKVIALSKPTSCEDVLLLNDMHRLRSEIFGSRLSWNVTVRDGREYDEFDDLQPTYILTVAGDSHVVGCARLLPAIGPTMLERTFPQLLASGTLNAHPAMVESSRFCVDTLLERRGEGSLHDITLMMFAAIIEWCLLHGYREIATATDVRFERLLARAGWPMSRLGEPKMINETNSVAGLLVADQTSFDRVRPASYRSDFHLSKATAAQESAPCPIYSHFPV